MWLKFYLLPGCFPFTIRYCEGRQLVEAVSLEEACEVLPLLSPHCPVAIPASLSLWNYGWSLLLDSKIFYLGSTEVQFQWNADENRCRLPSKLLRLLMIPGEFTLSEGIFFLRFKDQDAAGMGLPGAKVTGGEHTALFCLGFRSRVSSTLL